MRDDSFEVLFIFSSIGGFLGYFMCNMPVIMPSRVLQIFSFTWLRFVVGEHLDFSRVFYQLELQRVNAFKWQQLFMLAGRF